MALVGFGYDKMGVVTFIELVRRGLEHLIGWPGLRLIFTARLLDKWKRWR